jgi:hypothetical protein
VLSHRRESDPNWFRVNDFNIGHFGTEDQKINFEQLPSAIIRTVTHLNEEANYLSLESHKRMRGANCIIEPASNCT